MSVSYTITGSMGGAAAAPVALTPGRPFRWPERFDYTEIRTAAATGHLRSSMSIWGSRIEGGWDEGTGMADTSQEEVDSRHDKLLKQLLGVVLVLAVVSMLLFLKAMM